MSYFNKKIVKDSIFEELKSENPMILITIPEGLADKVCCCLKRKDVNNKYYQVFIDNQTDTLIEIPFLDLYNYNKNILELGSVIMIEDTVNDKAVDWLVEKLNLNPMYKVMSSILDCLDQNYSVDSIQIVIDNIVENKANLSEQQLSIVRNMINYNLIEACPLEIVGDLIYTLNSIFDNSSWSDRRSARLFK